MIDTDKDWEQFAQQDAYYSVLTGSRFAGIKNDLAARGQFFKTGEQHVELVLDRLAHITSADASGWDVLDFGCGVGRLLIPFAARCHQVFGVDVSPTMLNEARHNISEFACDNAAVGYMQDIVHDRRFDLLHSFIVFQHIPVKKGMTLLHQLLSFLKPGGLLALHFTFSRTYEHSQFGWRLAGQFPSMIPFFRLMQGRNPLKPHMLMGRYDLNHVLHVLHVAGLQQCQVQIVNDGGNLGAMIFGRLCQEAASD